MRELIVSDLSLVLHQKRIYGSVFFCHLTLFTCNRCSGLNDEYLLSQVVPPVSSGFVLKD